MGGRLGNRRSALAKLLSPARRRACIEHVRQKFRVSERFTGRLLPRLPIGPRQRVLVVIAACFAAHLVEITLNAMAFAALHERAGFGKIEGEFAATALDFFYFSITSDTTLGVGDVSPEGLLRALVGIEALNGFLLITWSASFTYLMMHRYWHPESDR